MSRTNTSNLNTIVIAQNTICICREDLSFPPSWAERASNWRPAFAKKSCTNLELNEDWSFNKEGCADKSKDSVSNTGRIGGRNVSVENVLQLTFFISWKGVLFAQGTRYEQGQDCLTEKRRIELNYPRKRLNTRLDDFQCHVWILSDQFGQSDILIVRQARAWCFLQSLWDHLSNFMVSGSGRRIPRRGTWHWCWRRWNG